MISLLQSKKLSKSQVSKSYAGQRVQKPMLEATKKPNNQILYRRLSIKKKRTQNMKSRGMPQNKYYYCRLQET